MVSKKVLWAVIIAIIIVIASGAAAYYYSVTPAEVKPKHAVKIGIIQDLTGALAAYGKMGMKAAVSAIEYINDKMGGINGVPIEYRVEDGATNAEVGLSKFKKLVNEWGADFVLGPCNSGTDSAILPYAKEYKVIYFVFGTATSLTEGKGNRWIFRIATNARQGLVGLGKQLVEQGYKYFYGLGADYEWGHSVVEETLNSAKAAGATILGTEFCPVGETDYVPYLLKIPTEAEIVVLGFFAGDASRCVKQADEIGLTKRVKFVGMALQTGNPPSYFGTESAQSSLITFSLGAIRTENVPPELREYERMFREAVGVNDEGYYTGTTEQAAIEYGWVTWSEVFIIKRICEQVGWKGKEDHPKFIQALEGAKFNASFEFPRGDIWIRPQDHQGITFGYILHIINGKWETMTIIPAEDMTYPTTMDYTKEAL